MIVGKDGHPFCEVDEERLQVPGKQRMMEILCAFAYFKERDLEKLLQTEYLS